MSRGMGNLLYCIGLITAVSCGIGVTILAAKHGQVGRPITVPSFWIFLAGVCFSLIPLYIGYYYTTWQDLTGGVGRPSLFIIFVLAMAAFGILLNAIRLAIFK